MRRWETGEPVIRQMIAAGQLEPVPGNPEYTIDLIDRAAKKLDSAATLHESDPESAFTLAYDAARFLLTALLAAQGLRPKGGQQAGHRVVQDAVRAQFGNSFRFFAPMRQVRNHLHYPPLDAAAVTVSAEDAEERLTQVRDAVDRVRALTDQLALFR